MASTADVFEAELSRNPYSLHTWLGYLASCGAHPARARLALYDRAVAHLPGSYKLWMAYVEEAAKDVRRLRARAVLPRCPCSAPSPPLTPPLASPPPPLSPPRRWRACGWTTRAWAQ